ncbi:UNVERIFIED_CONTAM: hypothetical protein FKN15_000141 [Acipenser sinensis]
MFQKKKDFTQVAARYYTSVVNPAQIEEFTEGLNVWNCNSDKKTSSKFIGGTDCT